MNDAELKYYKALQKVFAEKMGPMRHGDPLLLVGEHEDIYCEDCLGNNVFSPGIYLGALRLPLPIDPVNPERGLWEMIDWARLSPSINESGNIAMWEVDENRNSFPQAKWNYPPTLALLKALAHQRGIEV